MEAEQITALMQSRIGETVTEGPSPFGNWLAPVLVKVEKGYVEASYEIRPEMANPLGNLHGGVTAAIIDDIVGAALFTVKGMDFFSTINLSVDFLAPVKAGTKIIAKANVIKAGKRHSHMNAEIYDEAGKLIATGRSNLLKAGA